MQVIPAIDILDGKVVRLHQGDFKNTSIYSHHPSDVLQNFKKHGIEKVHVVDLDGAKHGHPVNQKTIFGLGRHGIKLQVGGGIRTLDHAKLYLESGIESIILSTSALKNHMFWRELAALYGESRLILCLDVKGDVLSINGWLEGCEMTIEDALSYLKPAKQVMVTDTCRDGTLQGPNIDLYRRLKKTFPHLDFIAAGGVANIEDIAKLQEIGLSKAIVGKALYEQPTLLSDISRFNKYSGLVNRIDWDKGHGLVPAVIQGEEDSKVLMLGYMNREALKLTIEKGLVTFYSRTRQKLWLKGKTSGKLLTVQSIASDCDADTLLIKVVPHGPTCHRNTYTCFDLVDART